MRLIRRDGMTDHEFAAFLRRAGAIDSWRQDHGTARTHWYAADGTEVAAASYHGRGNANVTYYTAEV